MKVLNNKQLREADAYTIQHEPVASIELMERAANACVNWLMEHLADDAAPTRFVFFCGRGNNGGDGLAMARLLMSRQQNVEVYIVGSEKKCSADGLKNKERLEELGVSILELDEHSSFPVLTTGDVVIDALFGSGLTRPVEGWLGALIAHINAQAAFTVSIDLPSGLFSDDNSMNDMLGIIKADVCLTFQCPKLAFLMPTTGHFAGWVVILDIGLHADYFAHVENDSFFVTKQDVQPLISPRLRFSHKGSYGHALLLAGSKGKVGAAVMAAKACLRSGAGKLTVQAPECALVPLQTTVPEAMTIADVHLHFLTEALQTTSYSAIGIGPGIGTEEETAYMLKLTIQNATTPLVLDADALNLLAMNPTWMAFLPPDSILTPHPGEFRRLSGDWQDDTERLQLLRKLSVQHAVFIVLKGANTAISTPQGKVYYNSTGNPGMATAGSGDVLTGILLAFLAQGYPSQDAAVLAVYIHGLAGDLAKKEKGETAMIASDLIDCLPAAFLAME
jgi:hydroxyethylthiazole kinase-like uncharacterized protein yjeF